MGKTYTDFSQLSKGMFKKSDPVVEVKPLPPKKAAGDDALAYFGLNAPEAPTRAPGGGADDGRIQALEANVAALCAESAALGAAKAEEERKSADLEQQLAAERQTQASAETERDRHDVCHGRCPGLRDGRVVSVCRHRSRRARRIRHGIRHELQRPFRTTPGRCRDGNIRFSGTSRGGEHHGRGDRQDDMSAVDCDRHCRRRVGGSGEPAFQGCLPVVRRRHVGSLGPDRPRREIMRRSSFWGNVPRRRQGGI